MFIDKLLKKSMFPKDAKAAANQLVIDKFIEVSTKSGARKIRGESNSVRLNVWGFGHNSHLVQFTKIF